MQSTNNFRQKLGQLTLKINQDSPTTPLQRTDSQEDPFEAKFILGDKLGEGAHCAVFKALSKQDNKEYAVKVFRTFDEEMIEIIKRTFLIQQMTNNNQQFLMTYDLFLNPSKGIHHMVLEYCPFPTLESLIQDHIKLHIQRIIIRNLAKAILYIHSKRICHRDIKPDNILVDIQTGNIKLIDFGVAQIFGGPRDLMMTPTGDPKYRAPEVTSTYGYDEGIDIWSLGIVAYQMFTASLDVSNISLEKYSKQNPSHIELIGGMLEENQIMRRTAYEVLQQIQQTNLTNDQLNTRSRSVDQKQTQTPNKKETKSSFTYSRKDVLKNHSGRTSSPKHIHDPCQINKTLLSKVMAVTESSGSFTIKLQGVINIDSSPNTSVSLDSTEDCESWVQK